VQEPLPDGSALRGLQNLVITPHVAGSTPAALAGMASGAARNLLDFLRGQSMQHAACANRQVLG
jgi:D-3-phosphoglycerate dehydrogenase